MAKKINLEDIDESFIIASIKKDKNPVPENPQRLLQPLSSQTVEQQSSNEIEKELPKEENRSKRARLQEYETLFIKEVNLPPARFGKSVFIRKEYHDRISQIISVIGFNEISLFGYIDNVLTHHFDIFGDEIALLFRKNIIFK
jgi:hypothetical protein